MHGWASHNPDGYRLIRVDDFSRLLLDLPPPLGFKDAFSGFSLETKLKKIFKRAEGGPNDRA